VAQVFQQLRDAGEQVFEVGRLVDRTTDGCTLKNLEAWN
jgi:hypothetical protein